MKKIIKISILKIIIIIALILLLMYNSKENIVIGKEYLYEKVEQYLISQEHPKYFFETKYSQPNYNVDDFKVFTDIAQLGIRQKGNETYVYVWALVESYYVQDGKLIDNSGSSIPYKFIFKNDEIVDYKIPRDGSEYDKSLKEIFPTDIRLKLNSNQLVNPEKLNTEVKTYYSYLENNSNVSKDTKNYIENLQIAYSNENDKENSNFIYSNNVEINEYNWKQYIVENHTILKNMPEIDFSKFENLGDDFYCLKITDYETYNEYSEKYNFRKLDESDFNNIFVEIIVRKSSDNTIKYNDMIEGYEYVTNENNYTFPVTIGGMLDVDENFKYPCLVAYFPNYYNKHFDNFYFKVIVQNENMNISKDKALQIAQNYLSNLTYKGYGNFTDMDYERFIQTYANNFLNTEDKEHPVEDTKEVYTVWSVSAYSKDDPCTWANVYVDIVTGKIVGGALNYATD